MCRKKAKALSRLIHIYKYILYTMFIYIYVHIANAHMYLITYAYIYTNRFIRIRRGMRLVSSLLCTMPLGQTYICMYIHIFICTYIFIYIYKYMYVYLYICIYIITHSSHILLIFLPQSCYLCSPV
jgi:hypothetical protein